MAIDTLKLGSVEVHAKSPVAIVAEVACEHQGDLLMAKKLAKLALESGADIVKFQLHLPLHEMIPGSISFWAGKMDDILNKVNLTVEAHIDLMDYCEKIGIQYLCTPFCSEAAKKLKDIGVPAFKIGSGELTNLPMIEEVVSYGLPIILSTGMATVDEIDITVSLLKQYDANFMLAHCTSVYPPKMYQINLGLIPFLANRYKVLIGHSDHTPNGLTAIGAVSVGAKLIEKHFTIDRSFGGPDAHVSLEPKEFSQMVKDIRNIEPALGDKKMIYPEEMKVRSWAHHSIVTLSKIEKGEKLTSFNLGVKRPGTGIPARHYRKLIGRKATRDLPVNTLIDWKDIL